MKFYDGMYNAIADDLSEPVTAVDGVRVMRVIDAAFESQQSRAIVKLQFGWPQHRWPIFVGHSRRLDAA